MADLTIALAGNPNAGKSTIFNALTGLRQHTGNWPGKTVEKKTGARIIEGHTVEFVDLPGTYSLAAYSPDEIVARDFILHEHPDAVICVIDATNLERNLYLVIQLLEMGVPVIVALNMVDQARSLGINIDYQQLSDLLGDVPVIPTTASRGQGIDQLLKVLARYLASNPHDDKPCRCQCESMATFRVSYGQEIEAAIQQLSTLAESTSVPLNGYCSRWLALKLLEGERDIVQNVSQMSGGQVVVQEAKLCASQLEQTFGDDLDIITADYRYGTVSRISRQVSHRSSINQKMMTERIDHFATHRWFGLPIFLLVMYLVFRLVIDVSTPFLDWVDSVINGPIANGLSFLLFQLGAPEWLHSLLIDGIVAGVGGILTFVPGLIVLFFFLALLEDSGYMARAAFVMDRFMQYIGLHGKSVIPLMLGFGCAVPAIYATRTIANQRHRLLTALLIPFMSCSARLPVYVVFALAFFGARASTVIWLMYVAGVLMAIIVGLILSHTLLKPDEKSAFVLELPPYRMPTINVLAIHTWENTREFIKQAGTVILAISIILWLLLNLPWGVSNQEESYYGRFSAAITPVFGPTGFGSYETSGALLTGFIAKELVVSTLSQVYTGVDGEAEVMGNSNNQTTSIGAEVLGIAVGFSEAAVDVGRKLISLLPGINLLDDGTVVENTVLSQALQRHFSPLSAVAFLMFVLLYIPCVATIGAIKQEFGGRWAASAAVYQTLVAWLVAVAIYQGGRIIGLG